METINVWPRIFLNALKECNNHEDCGPDCPLYVKEYGACVSDYFLPGDHRLTDLEEIVSKMEKNIKVYDKHKVESNAFKDSCDGTDVLLRVKQKLDGVYNLFEAKNAQYSTDDPFANFTTGANLLFGEADYIGKFEALKAYVAKHIAHVYNNNLAGPKVKESIQDIVVYFIIAWIMADLMEAENEAEKIPKAHQEKL